MDTSEYNLRTLHWCKYVVFMMFISCQEIIIQSKQSLKDVCSLDIQELQSIPKDIKSRRILHVNPVVTSSLLADMFSSEPFVCNLFNSRNKQVLNK